MAEVLAELTPREERILRMRFGIRMPDHTLEQVSKTFGVTRERIRQIEAKALQKLSDPARARKLLTFTKADRRVRVMPKSRMSALTAVTVIIRVDRRAPSISRRAPNSYMSERKADGGSHGHVDYPP